MLELLLVLIILLAITGNLAFHVGNLLNVIVIVLLIALAVRLFAGRNPL